MNKLWAYLKRRGFTLVEALVATVIAGYCILPVVGTLQSGMDQTQSFDHREKLRILARSRLNKELSVGAFDHTAIDTSTSYHYIYYDKSAEPKLLSIDTNVASGPVASEGSFLYNTATVSSILYSYKISVSVDENLQLGTSSLNINSSYLSGLGGLKAVTVLAELEPNDNVIATDSISLFSLLSLPSFTDDYIWISNPKNVEIISIDPISRTKVDSFLLPLKDSTQPRDNGANDDSRPWNIAVHPSKRFIAIQCKYKIIALNIDRTSPHYGKVKEIWPSSIVTLGPSNLGTYASKLADVKKDDKTVAAEDRGITFRPDGKMCFVAAHDEKAVFSFVASYTHDWDNLHLIASSLKKFITNKYKSSFLHAGNDGYLYSGPTDAKIAYRFPMYAANPMAQAQTIDDPDSNENVEGIATSPDGQEFFVLWGASIITRHSSRTGKKLGDSAITPTDASKALKDITLGGDGRYLAMMDPSDAAGKGGMFMLDLGTQPIYTTDYSYSAFKRATPDAVKKTGVNYVLFAPQSREFVFDDITKPNIFSVDIPGMNANTYSSSVPEDRAINFAPSDKSEVNMAVRPADYFLIGSVDGGKSYIEYADPYMMTESNPMKRKTIESMRIDLATSAVCIGLSRSGEKMRVGFGPNRAGLDIFETYGSRTALNGAPQGAQKMYGVVTLNEDYIIDNPCETFISMDYSPSATWANGYWANVPLPTTPIPPDYRNPNDVDLPLGWQGQDIETMQNGGVLILYRHTSTNDSMLEWIGKHKWGPHAGKYERFARWYSTANKFPPHNSRNMALSADDRYLAIESASDTNIIYLYDFSANNFAGLTQQNGLLIDYRKENKVPWTFDNVMASCSFALNNPSATLGIKLRDCTTASDTWPSVKTWPANYFYKINAALTASTNNAKKASANKRYIGYLRPETQTNMLAVSQLDFSRLYLDLKPVTENPNEVCTNLEYPASMTAFTQKPIQIDTCRANTTVRKISCGPVSVPGWEDDPCTAGSTHVNLASSVANIGNEPEILYQKHRWIEDGTLSYSFPDVPDGPAIVKLHFNDNYFDSTGQRLFNIVIEGVTKVSNFDIIHYAAASNTAVVISYDDVVVSTAGGGAGLQIDLVNTAVNNSLICGIEFTAPGDSYLGLYSVAAETTAGTVASTSLTPTDKNTMSMAGWQRIASTSTMPFAFQPVCLRQYPLTGTSFTSSTGMTFSRDLANPILYIIEGANDDLWCLKPGHPITRIDLPSVDITNKQLTVSNDGQRLIYGRADAREVYILDISDPNTFKFDGNIRSPQSSLTGFGQLLGTVSTQGIPEVFADMPFNVSKSTPASGSYEFVATLSNTLCGINNAAVASGGIYILGGSQLESGAATNTIYCFNPLASYTANITPLAATLTRRISKHATVTYDGELYTFNGSDSTGITDLVQKFNPTTGEILAYQPPPPTGVTTAIWVSSNMTDDDSPYPYKVTHTGSVRWTGSTYESGWKACDGDTSRGWAATSAGQSIIYDFGAAVLAPVINRIRIHNNTNDPKNGVNDFSFYGSTDNTNWTALTSGNVPKGSTEYRHNFFTNVNPYRYYKFTATSNHGGSLWCVREMILINANLRKISPSGMTSTIKDGKTVSTSYSSGSEPGWKAFDGSTSSEWDSDRNFPGSEWIAMDLGSADNVNVVRILCQYGNDDGIKDFKLEWSSDTTTWTAIPLLTGGATTTRNPSNGVWNTFYFNNSNNYQHYRIFITSTTGDEIEVKELEFYSTTAVAAPEEQFFMTKTMTDNLAPIKVQENAACLTPYGIVIAGGRPTTTSATATSLVYWPHGFHYFNSQTDYSLGISRSLPDLKSAVSGHVLIWHKNKVWRMCGASGTTILSDCERFDFDQNEWLPQTMPSAIRRHKAAVCSFGDEIFVFGGELTVGAGSALTTAYAWNPDTTEIRQLPDLPKTTTYAMSAVPCGSAIYLIGGSGTAIANNSATIIKYTP